MLHRSGTLRKHVCAHHHRLEATDAQHRYGSNLEPYHAAWAHSSSTQPFFHWLDAGDGKELELPEVPRATLAAQKLHVSLHRQLSDLSSEVSSLWLDVGDGRELELPEASRAMTLAAEGFHVRASVRMHFSGRTNNLMHQSGHHITGWTR